MTGYKMGLGFHSIQGSGARDMKTGKSCGRLVQWVPGGMLLGSGKLRRKLQLLRCLGNDVRLGSAVYVAFLRFFDFSLHCLVWGFRGYPVSRSFGLGIMLSIVLRSKRKADGFRKGGRKCFWEN